MKNGAHTLRPRARSSRWAKAQHSAVLARERLRLTRELRQLSALVIEAQEAERRRIARELHDGVNQVLSSAAFGLGLVEGRLGGEAREAREELARAKTLLTRGIDEIQRISEGLRPSELDALGLAAAVRSLCREIQGQSNLALDFECEAFPQRLPDAAELTLYRIIQEALHNIGKHSGATQAALRLRWGGSFINLAIHDNGRGLARAARRGRRVRPWGMGLVNMRERAAFLGGTFSIQSIRGQGTEIVVRIPVAGLAGWAAACREGRA